jgi:hypothetical protein
MRCFKTICNDTKYAQKITVHSFVVFNSYSGIAATKTYIGPNSEIGIRRIIGL